jgi:hypothetical protein
MRNQLPHQSQKSLHVRQLSVRIKRRLLGELRMYDEMLVATQTLIQMNRISLSRATALTFVANSLLTSFRLRNAEDRIAVKDPENLRNNWTGVPRPDRGRALIRAQQPIADSTDSTHSPVPLPISE